MPTIGSDRTVPESENRAGARGDSSKNRPTMTMFRENEMFMSQSLVMWNSISTAPNGRCKCGRNTTSSAKSSR